uniref:Uncharacterized protein n=1 Tax=Rhizophora mucronata TaxID=61149 RepID=A0A2P2J428_RHIMU
MVQKTLHEHCGTSHEQGYIPHFKVPTPQ